MAGGSKSADTFEKIINLKKMSLSLFDSNKSPVKSMNLYICDYFEEDMAEYSGLN